MTTTPGDRPITTVTGGDSPTGGVSASETEGPRVLSPAARRALAEAEARRAERERQRAAAAPAPGQREIGGREGPDPTRYGDWETKGIISDF